jgi:hypothetical protein
LALHQAISLGIGFAGLTVGFGILFHSIAEVDAWNASAPLACAVVDLVAAAGVSAAAIARLRQLSNFAGLRLGPDRRAMIPKGASGSKRQVCSSCGSGPGIENQNTVFCSAAHLIR